MVYWGDQAPHESVYVRTAEEGATKGAGRGPHKHHE